VQFYGANSDCGRLFTNSELFLTDIVTTSTILNFLTGIIFFHDGHMARWHWKSNVRLSHVFSVDFKKLDSQSLNNRCCFTVSNKSARVLCREELYQYRIGGSSSAWEETNICRQLGTISAELIKLQCLLEGIFSLYCTSHPGQIIHYCPEKSGSFKTGVLSYWNYQEGWETWACGSW
jgi:hypothetical protein